MKFLFINYDQGTSGEWLCSKVSQAAQCEKLQWARFGNRYKVKDCFDQEFLKPSLDWSAIHKKYQTLTKSELWRVVPTHRNFSPSNQGINYTKLLRIQPPKDQMMLLFTRYQRIKKVFLAPEPSDFYFLGLIKIIYQQNSSVDFLKKINRDMDGLSLILLGNGVAPTREEKAKYITKFLSKAQDEDMTVVNYDVLLPYEFLIQDQNKIKSVFFEQFEIDLDGINLTEVSQHFDKFSSWADVDCLHDVNKALSMSYQLLSDTTNTIDSAEIHK